MTYARARARVQEKHYIITSKTRRRRASRSTVSRDDFARIIIIITIIINVEDKKFVNNIRRIHVQYIYILCNKHLYVCALRA